MFLWLTKQYLEDWLPPIFEFRSSGLPLRRVTPVEQGVGRPEVEINSIGRRCNVAVLQLFWEESANLYCNLAKWSLVREATFTSPNVSAHLLRRQDFGE